MLVSNNIENKLKAELTRAEQENLLREFFVEMDSAEISSKAMDAVAKSIIAGTLDPLCNFDTDVEDNFEGIERERIKALFEKYHDFFFDLLLAIKANTYEYTTDKFQRGFIDFDEEGNFEIEDLPYTARYITRNVFQVHNLHYTPSVPFNATSWCQSATPVFNMIVAHLLWGERRDRFDWERLTMKVKPPKCIIIDTRVMEYRIQPERVMRLDPQPVRYLRAPKETESQTNGLRSTFIGNILSVGKKFKNLFAGFAKSSHVEEMLETRDEQSNTEIPMSQSPRSVSGEKTPEVEIEPEALATLTSIDTFGETKASVEATENSTNSLSAAEMSDLLQEYEERDRKHTQEQSQRFYELEERNRAEERSRTILKQIDKIFHPFYASLFYVPYKEMQDNLAQLSDGILGIILEYGYNSVIREERPTKDVEQNDSENGNTKADQPVTHHYKYQKAIAALHLDSLKRLRFHKPAP